MSVPNAMTLTSTFYEVASKLQSFNDAAMELNENFQLHPTKISVKKIQRVYQELRSLEGRVENQIEKTEQSKQCCSYFRNIEGVTAIVIAIRLFAWSLLGAGQITNLVVGMYNKENLVRPVLVLISALVGALFIEVVGPAIKDIDDDKDKQRVLDELQDIKSQLSEAKQFHEFLESYTKFKKSDRNNPEKLKALITKCIKRLDNTPESYRRNIPSKDHWVSLMFQMLPKDHPIKRQIRELKYAANEIFKLEESEEILEYDSTSSSNSSTSSPLTVRNKSEISESESDDTSSKASTTSKKHSDNTASTRFTRSKRKKTRKESAAASSSSASSYIESEPSASGYVEESDDSGFSSSADELQLPSLQNKVQEMLRGLRKFRGEKLSVKSPFALQGGNEKDRPNEAQVLAKSLKQEYQEYWKSLEDNLSIKFDCLSLDGRSFSRNCETAGTIEELQRRVPESSERGEEEFEVVIK